jgi:hypothetical protein
LTAIRYNQVKTGRTPLEAVERAPGLDERVLRGLLDVALIVEQAGEQPTHPPLVAAHQLGEGVEVAGPSLRDEAAVIAHRSILTESASTRLRPSSKGA